MAAVIFRDHQGKILDGDVKRVHVKSVLQEELAAGYPFRLCHGQREVFRMYPLNQIASRRSILVYLFLRVCSGNYNPVLCWNL